MTRVCFVVSLSSEAALTLQDSSVSLTATSKSPSDASLAAGELKSLQQGRLYCCCYFPVGHAHNPCSVAQGNARCIGEKLPKIVANEPHQICLKAEFPVIIGYSGNLPPETFAPSTARTSTHIAFIVGAVRKLSGRIEGRAARPPAFNPARRVRGCFITLSLLIALP